MFQCPACRSQLRSVKTAKGLIYGCQACGGRSITVPVLRQASTHDFVRGLLIAAREHAANSTRRCPYCDRRMRLVRMPTPPGPLELDYCKLCNQVWFDPKEYEAVPHAAPGSQQLLPKAREAVATFRLRAQAADERAIDSEPPEAAWQYLPALLGLPEEFNDQPLAGRPWMTWTLSAVMAFFFTCLVATGTLASGIAELGFIPQQWQRQAGLTMLTSFLLHGGVLHLLSNLYFVLVFGNNVEDHLGQGKFVLLLMMSHLAGLLLHCLGDPRGDVPLVGASGGIAGVLAYYAVTFPRARLGFILRFGFIPLRWFRISAPWALAIFVAIQLLGAWRQSLGLSGVSSFGHLGGLAVGLVVGLWVRMYAQTPQGRRSPG